MIIDIIGMTDSEKEEILTEITANGFEWNWTDFGGITVWGSDYSIKSFTMWLNSIDVLWCDK